MLSGITYVAGYFTYYLERAGYHSSMSYKIQIAHQILPTVGISWLQPQSTTLKDAT